MPERTLSSLRLRFTPMGGQVRELAQRTFKRCGNCRHWLWDDGWHSLEPKAFRDHGGHVEIVTCHVCRCGGNQT